MTATVTSLPSLIDRYRLACAAIRIGRGRDAERFQAREALIAQGHADIVKALDVEHRALLAQAAHTAVRRVTTLDLREARAAIRAALAEADPTEKD